MNVTDKYKTPKEMSEKTGIPEKECLEMAQPKSKPENPLAFPVQWGMQYTSEGMTLRDYFAGQVLIQCTVRAQVNNNINARLNEETDDVYTVASAEAYQFADAMLKARQS